MCTEKRIFNNESVRPDIPLSPNIFRRVEAGTAAVFREKIFPICLGSQSGAPSLKPEKREREGDSENLRERERRGEKLRGWKRVRRTWCGGDAGREIRVMVENPSSELKRDVVKLNNVCNIYTRESFIRARRRILPLLLPCSSASPASARRANVTLGCTSAVAEYLCDNPPRYSPHASRDVYTTVRQMKSFNDH